MWNQGVTRAGNKEKGESIRTICWLKTTGRIHSELERDRRISGEPEVARKNNSEKIQQCWHNAPKYLVSAGVLYHRWKSN